MYTVSTVHQEGQEIDKLKMLPLLDLSKLFWGYHFSDEIDKFDASIKVQS